MLFIFSLLLFACSQAIFTQEIPSETHCLARVVIIHNDHLLCAYDPKIAVDGQALFYHLPGCHIEFNQDAKTSLENQMRNKLNLPVDIFHCVGAFERSWDGEPKSITCHKHEITLVFKAALSQAYNELLPTVESKKPSHLQFCWIPLKDIATLDVRPHVLPQMIPTWMGNKDSFLAQEMHIS